MPLLSLGQWTIVVSLVLVVDQFMLALPNEYWSELMIEIVFSFIFGNLIDMTMSWLQSLSLEVYWQSLGLLLAGCFVISWGAYLEIIADVAMLPGDAFVREI